MQCQQLAFDHGVFYAVLVQSKEALKHKYIGSSITTMNQFVGKILSTASQ
jgi:hypothetical protein